MGPNLCDKTRTRFNNRDRDRGPRVVEDLGHAHLSSNQTFEIGNSGGLLHIVDCRFFATQPMDEVVANEICYEIVNEVRGRLALPTIEAPNTVEELVAVMRQADLIVSTRFHGVVLGLWMCKPVLAICYHRKTKELMKSMKLVELMEEL